MSSFRDFKTHMLIEYDEKKQKSIITVTAKAGKVHYEYVASLAGHYNQEQALGVWRKNRQFFTGDSLELTAYFPEPVVQAN